MAVSGSGSDGVTEFVTVDPETVVRRYVDDVLNGRRRNAVGTLFAPNYVDHDPVKGMAEGRNGVHQLIELLGRRGEHFEFRLADLIPVGDRVAYRVFATGYSFPPGRRADGIVRVFTASVVGIFRVENGRIVERWGTWRLHEM